MIKKEIKFFPENLHCHSKQYFSINSAQMCSNDARDCGSATVDGDSDSVVVVAQLGLLTGSVAVTRHLFLSQHVVAVLVFVGINPNMFEIFISLSLF